MRSASLVCDLLHARHPTSTSLGKQGPPRFGSVRARAQNRQDPYQILGISRGSSRVEIREAYVEKIRRFHPDVSTEENAADMATSLNIAYQELMVSLRSASGEDLEPLDVFDFPETEPDRLFVNPFACNVNPMQWRQLQEVALQGGEDPVQILSQSGVFAPDSAIFYLSAAQLQALEEELAEMEACLGFEFTAWSIAEKLSRARRANIMVPVRR